MSCSSGTEVFEGWLLLAIANPLKLSRNNDINNIEVRLAPSFQLVDS